MNQQALCWINEKIVAAHEAHISVYDHGLLYGDGVFEGLRFYGGKVFKLEAHLLRLQQSADAIALKIPYSLQRIQQAISQLIAEYPRDSGYLRLVVTRGKGSLGIDPQKCPTASLFIIADDLQVIHNPDPDSGVKLLVASTRRMPAECLDPAIKSLNYLNNILARIEANKAGMDEAVMLNLQGFVTEGTVDNIFMIKDGILMTPKLSDGLLQGITRDTILQIAEKMGIPTQQTSLTIDDFLQAEECFLTGTGAELIPVRQINQHVLSHPQKPLFIDIAHAFEQTVLAECAPGHSLSPTEKAHNIL